MEITLKLKIKDQEIELTHEEFLELRKKLNQLFSEPATLWSKPDPWIHYPKQPVFGTPPFEVTC